MVRDIIKKILIFATFSLFVYYFLPKNNCPEHVLLNESTCFSFRTISKSTLARHYILA